MSSRSEMNQYHVVYEKDGVIKDEKFQATVERFISVEVPKYRKIDGQCDFAVRTSNGWGLVKI